MQVLEFAQRFLNYKSAVMIINNHTGKVEFAGMFMDAPYRFLRFADVVRIDVDTNDNALKIYITSNSKIFFDTTSHFQDNLLTE